VAQKTKDLLATKRATSPFSSLEPVRVRPGMYIGSTGPSGLHHLIRELVDNAVDEAMAGVCTRIDVTVLADGSCRVSDDGRGIPVEEHPQYPVNRRRKSYTRHCTPVEVRRRGYKVSGGLHGVGASIVNALSPSSFSKSTATTSTIKCPSRTAQAQGKLKVTGPAPRGRTGTSVTFTPDPTIFDDVDFRAQPSLSDCRSCVLNRVSKFDSLTNAWDASQKRRTSTTADRRLRRHLNNAKESLFRKVGFYEQTEPGKRSKWPSVEHGLLREHPLVRERHRDH